MFNIDKVTEIFVGIVIFASISVALIPTVLTSFTNLSSSGLVLGTLFSTVLVIVLSVAVFRAILKSLKF